MGESVRAYINCPQCERHSDLPRNSRNRLEEGLQGCAVCCGAGRVLKYRSGMDYMPGAQLLAAGWSNGCRNVMMEDGCEPCRKKLAKRAAMTPHGVACVGCDRLCRCPDGVEPGDEIRIINNEK